MILGLRISQCRQLSWKCIQANHIKEKGTHLCIEFTSVLLPLCCKAFSENATPHQQHWANSVQKSPSNHLYVIGRWPPKCCVMLIGALLKIQRESSYPVWGNLWYNMDRSFLPPCAWHFDSCMESVTQLCMFCKFSKVWLLIKQMNFYGYQFFNTHGKAV